MFDHTQLSFPIQAPLPVQKACAADQAILSLTIQAPSIHFVKCSRPARAGLIPEGLEHDTAPLCLSGEVQRPGKLFVTPSE